MIPDNAIDGDTAPRLKCFYRCLCMRSEIAIDPLRRRVPLARGTVRKHRLQTANYIAGRTLLQCRHWTPVRQSVPSQWSNNTSRNQASRLLKLFHRRLGWRIECSIDGESEVRSATQSSL